MPEHLYSVDPATDEVIAAYEIDDENRVEDALKRSVNTYHLWRKLSFEERSKMLKKIAVELRKESENMARLATAEMGKPIQQSRDEVEKCAKTLEFYADEGAAMLANEIIPTDAKTSYVAYRPLGVIFAIMPWNFPYWQVFRAMAPALMAGNVMVLKHASNVCGCARAIADVVMKAGAPEGLFQTLLVPSGRVEHIIGHRAIAAITLTGSTAAGSKVAEASGRHLKKLVLELGGSDAYVILEDADLDLALEIALRGRLVNSGQSCISAKRFIVMKPVREAFEQRYTDLMKKVVFGDPMDPGSRIGPMARKDLRDQLHEQVLRSVALGATVLCGGYIPEGRGAYYPATVLGQVKKGMPAYEEELFGPVAAIIEADDEQHAMYIANDTVCGLGGGIISANRAHAEMLAAEELEAGNCYVNDFVHSDPRLPFGGIKQSGYGRELGTYGIREFVNIKSVYIK